MLELVDKLPDDLAVWVPAMFAGYVEERIAAGEDPATARAAASAQSDQLFPGGTPAEGQHVMDLVLDGTRVGSLWLGRPLGGDQATWYVFYVEIDEASRGRGFGRQAMVAAEQWSVAHGGSRIALNVFGHNAVARSLYDSLGYRVLATGLYKDL